jgi:8-oxo-dGTP pyrophosphatase MutT (NUDIX family)
LDTSAVIAAGAFIFSENTGRYLWLLRNKTLSAGHWAFPGGKLTSTETVFQGLQREILEELGVLPRFKKVIPLEKFTSWNSRFVYYNFWILVPQEFDPRLNDEHAAFQWCAPHSHPRPLHPVIADMLATSEIANKLRTAELLGA